MSETINNPQSTGAGKSQERMIRVKPASAQSTTPQNQAHAQDTERSKLVKKASAVVLQPGSQPTAGINSFISLAIQANSNKAKLQGQGQAVQARNAPLANHVGPKSKLNLHKKPLSIGHYTLGEIIGRGAHGKVYRATDTKQNTVAVKLFTQLRPDMKQQISQEIALLKKLDHQNIVKYIDSVQSDHQLAIVLEFVESGSLEDLIKRHGGCFTETIVAVYIKQVLRGLEYLHRCNVIHRDIKGANILTTREGVVKVADFGVATKLEDGRHSNNKSDAFAGTPYWMAPEVIEMQPYITTACDIWSLGCTVFELLKGSPPNFDLNQFSAMIKIVKEAGQMPLPDGISAELTDFLNQCFRKVPEERPSATQLLEHRWLKQMSNESKIAKIMNLKLPQEVHNTIRVHLKKNRERDLQQQRLEAPHATIAEPSSSEQQQSGVLSPSTLVEDKQAIANIVKLQHFQSRNPNLAAHSLTAVAVSSNDPKLGQQQFVQNPSSATQDQTLQPSRPQKQQTSVLAQKNLIKLQSSRLQNSMKSPPNNTNTTGVKSGNLIDLRIQPNAENKKLAVVKGDDQATAPESQQVTEYVQNDDAPDLTNQSSSIEKISYTQQHQKTPASGQQIVSIHLKQSNNGNNSVRGSRSRLATNCKDGTSSQTSTSAKPNTSQQQQNWQTASLIQQEQSSQKLLQTSQNNFNVLPGGQAVHQLNHGNTFNKQFYSTSSANNNVSSDDHHHLTSHHTPAGTNDYMNFNQRSVPVLADHSVVKYNKSSPINHHKEHSQSSQDFSKKVNPDQQLHIYTQQVPKKSPHAPSQPLQQQISSAQLLQKSATEFSSTSHSNLIARKPNSALIQQQHQVRLSSQAPMTVARKDANNKSQLFSKQIVTPVAMSLAGTTSNVGVGPIVSRTPAQQSQANSVFQTYEPASSDQKARIQQSRTVGTRTALSTLSAASYPTQPLLQTSSESIMPTHHPQHKSLGLVQKGGATKQQTPQVRQRSPTDPPALRTTAFMHPQPDLRDVNMNDDLERYLNNNPRKQSDDIVTNQDDEVQEGEVDDQSEGHQLLFTQVLERSLARKPSASQLAQTNRNHLTHSTRIQQSSELKRQSKQVQQQQAQSLAKELLDKDLEEPLPLLKKVLCQIKEQELSNQVFREVFMREAGSVIFINFMEDQPQTSLVSLQIINLLVDQNPSGLHQFCNSGLVSSLVQLVKQSTERKIQTEIAMFIDMLYQDSQLTQHFVAVNGLSILTVFLGLDYRTDKELIMMAIDRVLDLFDKRKKLALTVDDLCRLLIKAGLLQVLADLVPSLVRYADNQYRHGVSSSMMHESQQDASLVITEQNKAEKYLEKAFELLNKMCQASQDVRSTIARSSLMGRLTIQASIYECLAEPTAITFTLTKWFMHVIDACASSPDASKKDFQAMLSQDIELILLEMLTFYMGLVGHIQLASIYESLKLLFLLIRGSHDAVTKAVQRGQMLQIIVQLYNHLDVNERSRTKRSKLLQVCCNLWLETCQAGLIKSLSQHSVQHLCMAILEKEVILNQQAQSKKAHSQDLASKVVNFLVIWQQQDRNLDYLLAENLEFIVLMDVPALLAQSIKNSQLLTQTMLKQQILSQLLFMHQHTQNDQKAYYDVLLHLKHHGLNIKAVGSYITPPLDSQDGAARQMYTQLLQSYQQRRAADSSGGSLDDEDIGVEEDDVDDEVSGIESTSEEFN